jgi:hypothetical protein
VTESCVCGFPVLGVVKISIEGTVPLFGTIFIALHALDAFALTIFFTSFHTSHHQHVTKH